MKLVINNLSGRFILKLFDFDATDVRLSIKKSCPFYPKIINITFDAFHRDPV
jgi:hypothetical protein